CPCHPLAHPGGLDQCGANTRGRGPPTRTTGTGMSDLTPVADQRERILFGMRPLAAQPVPLTDAHGFRLAEAAYARFAVPPWDTSAMDGYAVRFADIAGAAQDSPVTLDVVADLPAGSSLDPALHPGQAARIMTGAVMPTDA